MQATRRAVIDVGTNSVKLLLADVAGRTVKPVREAGLQTRLGRGFYESHRLQSEAIARTAEAVAEFAGLARTQGVVSLRAFATSAARDAVNTAELVEAVKHAAGLKLEVISGEQEAEWAFQGVTSDPKLASETILLMDIGGGSTEFVLGQGESRQFQASYPIGAVRLLETMPHSDPPTAEQRQACFDWLQHTLDRTVRPQLGAALCRARQPSARQRPVLLVGAGGTATVLARMHLGLDSFDSEKIGAARVSGPQMERWMTRLWSLSLAGRRRIAGLPAERADVILTGVTICRAVMEAFQFDEMRITTRGLRFAALLDDSWPK